MEEQNVIHREILEQGQSSIEIKKSRFIGDSFFVKDEGQVLSTLEALKKTHYNARHICYAYRLAATPPLVKYSDDGEPSQTAGRPILETIENANLYNTLVCVTRYFGGVLLGTGGLGRAYRQAAKEAIENATVIDCHFGEKIQMEITYDMHGKIENLLRAKEITTIDTEFADKVNLTCVVFPSQKEWLKKEVTNLSHGTAIIVEGDTCKYAIYNQKFYER